VPSASPPQRCIYEYPDDDPFQVQTFWYERDDGRSRILKMIDISNDPDGYRRKAYQNALDILDPCRALGLETREMVPGRLLAVEYDALPGSSAASTVAQFWRLWLQLRALHNAEHVHCDVRKANMVFNDDGTNAWLIDFDMLAPPDTPYIGGYAGLDLLSCRHPYARRGALCYPEHDMHSLGYEMQQYRPQRSELQLAWTELVGIVQSNRAGMGDPFVAFAEQAAGRNIASAAELKAELTQLRLVDREDATVGASADASGDATSRVAAPV